VDSNSYTPLSTKISKRGLSMFALHPEYVMNEQQETRAVLLPINEWQLLLEAMEELEDIQAYDKVKAQQSDIIPFEQAIQEIQGKGI